MSLGTTKLSAQAATVGLAIVITLLAVGAPVVAQNTVQKSSSIDADKSDDQRNPFAGIEEEMRAKRAIKFAEKEYQENIDRARDLAVVSSAIVASFRQKKLLTSDDFKKLEKIEKLAKGIRSAAGGSEDEAKLDKPPTSLPPAMDMLEDLSKSLRESVERTPRHVISAGVIDQANVLLELIRVVRNLPPNS